MIYSCQFMKMSVKIFLTPSGISKIWVWSVDLMSWQGLCWILSRFTDFEGHLMCLFDAKCKMTCCTFWKSRETGESEIGTLSSKNGLIDGWEDLTKLSHWLVSKSQDGSTTITVWMAKGSFLTAHLFSNYSPHCGFQFCLLCIFWHKVE